MILKGYYQLQFILGFILMYMCQEFQYKDSRNSKANVNKFRVHLVNLFIPRANLIIQIEHYRAGFFFNNTYHPMPFRNF